MTAPAPARARASVPDLLLTVLSGPEAGVGYKLVGQSISLGRAPENDVVLHDNKSSRNHARIEQRMGEYWIVDLESQNGILVNGQKVLEKKLVSGDEILIGATALKFGSSGSSALMMSAVPPLPPTKSDHVKNVGAADPAAAGWLPPLPETKSRPKGKPTFAKVIVFLILLALAVIFLQSESVKRKIYSLKDENSLQTEIETIGQSNEKAQQEILQRGKDTPQYSEAQSFYLRGFREFREGNYSRAIQNFEASLALYPDHPLAKRYLSRSRLKLNETITSALERGERDFQLHKYLNAFNEYRTVLLLTNDSNNKSAQLAQKRIESINLILLNSK